MVMYTGRERTINTVQRLRLAFPAVIFTWSFCPSSHNTLFDWESYDVYIIGWTTPVVQAVKNSNGLRTLIDMQ